LARLSSHQRLGVSRPAKNEILRFVEDSASAIHHWQWDADGQARKFNRQGHAVLLAKTVTWLPRHAFVVARLLLDDFRGPYPPRSSFESTCGVAACVNPFHWERILPPISVRLQPSLSGWIAVRARTGRPVSGRVPLIVRGGDAATHIVSAGPEAVFHYETLCGLRVYPTNLVVHPSDTVVTCKRGCV
jgi:hypothetical protein